MFSRFRVAPERAKRIRAAQMRVDEVVDDVQRRRAVLQCGVGVAGPQSAGPAFGPTPSVQRRPRGQHGERGEAVQSGPGACQIVREQLVVRGRRVGERPLRREVPRFFAALHDP